MDGLKKTRQDGLSFIIAGFKPLRLKWSDWAQPVLEESKSCFGHGVNRPGAKFFAFISHSI